MSTPTPSVSPQLGSSTKDLVFVEALIKQKYDLLLATYPWYTLKDYDTHEPDLNVYGEPDYDADNPRPRYEDPIQVRLMVQLDPEQDMLDRYGLDQPQDALIVASQKLFRDAGRLPKIGDRFDFNEWQFEIKTVKEGSWFSNSKFPCEWVMTAERTHRRWPQ